MRKYIVILTLFPLLAAGNFITAQNIGYNTSYLIQDYITNYTWNKESGDWQIYTKVQAVYNRENVLKQNITIKLPENDTLSRIKYYYNSYGKLDYIVAENYISGTWITKYKQVTEYDDEGRRSSVTTYLPEGNNWINSARQYYLQYNEIGKLSSFHSQYWVNGDWNSVAIDYYEYDQKGDLIRQYRELVAGGYSFQAFYTYTNHLMLERFVQNYNRVTNSWINSYRDTYEYDHCGIRKQYIRERFLGGNWINEQKTVYTYKIAIPGNEKNFKVPVCHNGHTIFVSINALEAHIAHGDCIGSCQAEKESDRKPDNTLLYAKPPFTVFPNPARERLTIRFNRDLDPDIKRIELADNYGKVIRSFNVNGISDLTLERGNLISGNYYIRLIGAGIFSVPVIFE